MLQWLFNLTAITLLVWQYGNPMGLASARRGQRFTSKG